MAALLDWLEAHGGEATRREIQRARVAGARTKPQMDALLEAYEEYFPGHVVEEYGSHGGRPVVVVRAPERRIPTVTTGDTGVRPPRRGDEKPRSRGKSDDAEGDWPTVTTGAGDSGDAAHDGWRPHTEEEYVEAWRRRQQRLGGGT